MNGTGAIEAAERKADQRHRRCVDVDRMALAGDPVHPLRPHRDRALRASLALEQCEIELAAIEIAGEVLALVGAYIEAQARMRTRERAEQLRETIRREILGDAEPDRALAVGLAQHIARLFRKRQKPSCIG